jgi:hypothetical protein
MTATLLKPDLITFRLPGRVRLSHRRDRKVTTARTWQAGWNGCVLKRSVPTRTECRFGLTGPRIAV